MEYKGFKVTTAIAGMEGYAATIVDPQGISIGKVYSRESEDAALQVAREFIDKRLA
jgi:hypothetical protein